MFQQQPLIDAAHAVLCSLLLGKSEAAKNASHSSPTLMTGSPNLPGTVQRHDAFCQFTDAAPDQRIDGKRTVSVGAFPPGVFLLKSRAATVWYQQTTHARARGLRLFTLDRPNQHLNAARLRLLAENSGHMRVSV
ncbi:hypothetical protein PHYSODRAFT_306991 [Phytophthora sojae]|uniref:Uncharacterized protein n=1 Tax=Phytophthora sojae (strain P6497) TaxID=1094619 RepID=G5AC00_PHYSP|nr:hypothetical protein PHYSODRAFT_306991 [Phytophthora sojae]EGZ06875.1 hypothetical protein PHYSODRAFT_306991 [Phytophthora sojae]|eukprot:XP_009537639.1 hypothetical protein PHYSODRAFT_306991 [Phytophthora sojae]